MINCTTNAERVCIHDVIKCANCAEKHRTVNAKCSAKIRAEVKTKRVKLNRSAKIAKKKFVRIVIYNSARNITFFLSLSQEKNKIIKDQRVTKMQESNAQLVKSC